MDSFWSLPLKTHQRLLKRDCGPKLRLNRQTSATDAIALLLREPRIRFFRLSVVLPSLGAQDSPVAMRQGLYAW
jgi:hypothetical protein